MTPATSAPSFPFSDFQATKKRLLEAILAWLFPFLLLSGRTGAGKTALLRQLLSELDRCHYRIIYFSAGRSLGSSGLIRVLARTLRVPIRRSHAETVQVIGRHLRKEPQRLLLWIDDAHEAPDETFEEVRSLAESDLSEPFLLQILLAGLPPLRERLQALPPLWRRIMVREEIAGLTRDELGGFLEHHFGSKAGLLCPEGQEALFERARGLPGLLLPMFQSLLATADGEGPLDPLHVEDLLQTWDLA